MKGSLSTTKDPLLCTVAVLFFSSSLCTWVNWADGGSGQPTCLVFIAFPLVLKSPPAWGTFQTTLKGFATKGSGMGHGQIRKAREPWQRSVHGMSGSHYTCLEEISSVQLSHEGHWWSGLFGIAIYSGKQTAYRRRCHHYCTLIRGSMKRSLSGKSLIFFLLRTPVSIQETSLRTTAVRGRQESPSLHNIPGVPQISSTPTSHGQEFLADQWWPELAIFSDWSSTANWFMKEKRWTQCWIAPAGQKW